MARARGLLLWSCAVLLAAGCASTPATPTGAPTVTSSPSGTTSSAPAVTPTPTPSPTPSATPTPTPTSTPEQPERTDGCTVPARFAGQDVERLPLQDKLIALTFDAGANADGVPSIRATLLRTKVRATFFLTGKFAETYPAKSRRLADRDLVGNHTMTHPDLTALSDRAVTAQVRDAESAIRSVTGEDPRRFFRFPFGARDQHLVDLVNGLCYVPFRWTVDTLGWKGTSGGQSVSSVVSRVLDAAEPGAIVLMHLGSNPDDGTTLDADALPRIIKELRAEGYHFVRLSRVMSAAP